MHVGLNAVFLAVSFSLENGLIEERVLCSWLPLTSYHFSLDSLNRVHGRNAFAPISFHSVTFYLSKSPANDWRTNTEEFKLLSRVTFFPHVHDQFWKMLK